MTKRISPNRRVNVKPSELQHDEEGTYTCARIGASIDDIVARQHEIRAR
jgi:hypothetical protein